MKYKFLLLVITGILAIGITACGNKSVNNIDTTEIAVPENDTTLDSQLESLQWLQLSSLETHPELRQAFEKLLGITGNTGSKEGVVYYNPVTKQTDQNSTLLMTMKNSEFRETLETQDVLSKIEEIAVENYTDVELDDINAAYATINAYFELLPDQADGQFDGDSSITRAEAMTLVMRATTPVNESQAPETNNDFTDKVGENIYTDFAAAMNEYAYLNTSNGLTENTFNTAMSRGEYICLLTNLFNKNTSIDTSGTIISTLSDAGNITLSEAIADASKGVPTDMYNTFKVAIKMGYIVEEDFEDWDSAITKADAINLFITMANTIEISNSGSSMGEMSAPEIQSNDFVVEPFGPQTMYVIESVSGKEGPNESDFKEMGYLWKNESVSVIGVVKSYKGEECLWYRLNTGEFISSEYLTTEKPANASDVVGGDGSEETFPTSGESNSTNQDNQELPDINLDDIAGTPSNNSGQTTTADGRPFAQSHQNGGAAPSTHVWSN